MASSILQTLSSQYGISIQSSDDLKNGYTLMFIALKVLYSNNNHFIATKLSQSDSIINSAPTPSTNNKTGNNVIIINSLLKHIKSDNNITKQTWLKQLTFYNLLEDQNTLHKFINWMIQVGPKNHLPQLQNTNQKQTLPLKYNKSLNQDIYQNMTQEQINSISSNRFRNIQIPKPRFKTQEHQKQPNQFENLYFASNLKNKPQQQHIIISPQKGDKIVRKGSFKLLKPKVNFVDERFKNPEPMQFSESPKAENKQKKVFGNEKAKLTNQSSFYEPQELKQISMIEAWSNQMNQNMNVSQAQQFCQQSWGINETQGVLKNSLTSTPTLNSQQEEPENRKTVPKNLSKPPMYRSSSIKNKQNLQNGPSEKEKTIQQSLKKKNFFNFTQPEDIISTFNEEIGANKMFGGQIGVRENQSQNFGSSSKSKLFSKIKQLKNDQKSQMRQYMSLQNKQQQQNILIEQKDYQVHRNDDQSNQIQSKQGTQSKTNFQDGHSSSRILKLKNHFLQKQLYSLQKQISKEKIQLQNLSEKIHQQSINQQIHYQSAHKRSITSLHNQPRQAYQTTTHKNSSFDSTKKSNRKISKIQLNQLTQKDKETIIDWLDALHFIQKNKVNPYDIFEKFQDGTMFVQLCNHYIGRGKPLPCFRNPKKNAQIHSNYTKVFDYLKSFSQWDHPELLFSYELFVSYPQQNPIWSLLLGMFKLFTKKARSASRSASKNESLIYTKQNQSLINKSATKRFEPLEDISERQGHIQKVSRKQSSSTRKQSTFSKPIQFVRQIPEDLKRNDLVQQSEQHQSCGDNDQNTRQNQVNLNAYFEGYKDKYLRKTLQNSASKQKSRFTSLQTPKKLISNPNQQFQQSFIFPHGLSVNKQSLRKSSSKKILQNKLKKIERSSCKLLSAKKSEQGTQRGKILPKISLNMQIKVQKLLKHFKLNKLIDQKNSQKMGRFQLLQDPIRNGTLVNVLMGRFQREFEGKYIVSPHSIEDCRQNYMSFFGLIKNKYGQEGFKMFEKYLEFTEEILRGQKNLFYGISYSLLQLMEKKGFKLQTQLAQNCQNKASTARLQKQKIETVMESFCRSYIDWIRYLQRSNYRVGSYRIRTEQDLRKSISAGHFLYAFSENSSIKPVYLNPSSISQRQANLKKIICYLIQNKIVLDKEDFFNVKSIAQSNIQAINQLILKLIKYTVCKYGVASHHQPVNIVVSNDENQQIVSNREVTMNKSVALGKYLQEKNHKNPSARLQTTTAQYMNETERNYPNGCSQRHKQINRRHVGQDGQKQEQIDVQVPWMRKLGFTNCSLSINNGILLCRLIGRLTRTNIKFNENISPDAKIAKGQSLGYIRKAIRLIPGFRFDQVDIYEANSARTLEVYEVIKQKFRNTYQISKILFSK